MAFDHLTELTSQTQAFALGYRTGADPLTHVFSMLPPRRRI
jgi:hypothetical protein